MGARPSHADPQQLASQVQPGVAAQVGALAAQPGGASRVVRFLKKALPGRLTAGVVAATALALLSSGSADNSARTGETLSRLQRMTRGAVDRCSMVTAPSTCLQAAHRIVGYGDRAVADAPQTRWARTPYGQQGLKVARHARLRDYHVGRLEQRAPGPAAAHEFYKGVRLGDLKLNGQPIQAHLETGAGLTAEPLTVYRGAAGETLEHTFEHGLDAPYWRDASRHPLYPVRHAPQPDPDLGSHVHVGYGPGQVFTSTTLDPVVAAGFARRVEQRDKPSSAVYQIDLPAGKGLHTNFHQDPDLLGQKQVAVPGGVPGDRIRRAWRHQDIQKFVSGQAQKLEAMPAGHPRRRQTLERIQNPLPHVAAIENPRYLRATASRARERS